LVVSGKAKGNCQVNCYSKFKFWNNSRKQPCYLRSFEHACVVLHDLCLTNFRQKIVFVAFFPTKHRQKGRVVKKRMKTCSVDFNNKNLDISFYVFKPTVVIVEHLVHGLQHFSLLSENLGCVQSSIFRSIHGNKVSSSFLFLVLYSQLSGVCLFFSFLNST